jgi:hypothetical protein
MAKRRKRTRSGSGGKLLLLALLIGGLGAWNYQRNVEAESKEIRPYRAYSDADLESLELAFRAELEILDARYEQGKGLKFKATNQGFGQAQVDEFERVQRASHAKREIGYQAAEGQATLDAVVQERELRARQGPPWLAVLRRAFVPRV